MSIEITQKHRDKVYKDERMTTSGSYVNIWSTTEPKYDVFIIFNEPAGIVPEEKLHEIADLVRPIIENETLRGNTNEDIETIVSAYLELFDTEDALSWGYEVIAR